MVMINGMRVRPERIALLVASIVLLVYVMATRQQASLGLSSSSSPQSKLAKLAGKCPDYVEYSKYPHKPIEPGDYNYPFMRPPPKCRTFSSPAVERVIDDLKAKVLSPDLGRLIENCLPNTLDTTILWHTDKSAQDGSPHTFVVTGDIHAEWLRDAARQLAVYQPFVKHDPKLARLMVGAIHTQAFYINVSPYCNAFHPPPGSGIHKGNTAKDNVFPPPNWNQVFECKYEIDSLASFLTLSNDYYENLGGDTLFMDPLWWQAFEKVLVVIKRESVPLFDEESGRALKHYYSFKRWTDIGLETLPLGGVGNPVNFGTGLVRLAFRPSDDATILQFFIPGNIHAVTELKRTRKNLLKQENLGAAKSDFAVIKRVVDELIKNISEGLDTYGIIDHPAYGKVYAYEVDGYGGAVFMDDANIPSLLAMPDMGFVPVDDPVYQNTRKMILRKEGNPYYLTGAFFEGIGGPHVGIQNAWPMSLLVKIRTSQDDKEISEALELVMKLTAGLGLMHETVNVNSPGGRDYTRLWFAWCNSEFGKTILWLAKHKPHLIFKDGVGSYDIDKALRLVNQANDIE